MHVKIKRQLLITLLPAILVLITVAIVSVVFKISIPSFTRDVTAIANIHPLSGILSTLGILLWCIAASVTLFTAFIFHYWGQSKVFKFLFSSSLLSTYLMLDDAFLFHEGLASIYFGIDEKIILLALGVTVLAYLVSFRKTILKTNYSVLLLAFGFLTLSCLTDGILDPWFWSLGDWEYFIEDGAKWMGIVSWCSYYVQTSYLFIIKEQKLPENENIM
ncbi:hypothetical protein [Sulfurovum sp.]|uniref:hypothetical protein n=1 Tax=Sulfurovum sp. TaxID=1969726 RepID=UPI002867DAEB|nr:hypothetical protein [Sulfurovum sp.]